MWGGGGRIEGRGQFRDAATSKNEYLKKLVVELFPIVFCYKRIFVVIFAYLMPPSVCTCVCVCEGK